MSQDFNVEKRHECTCIQTKSMRIKFHIVLVSHDFSPLLSIFVKVGSLVSLRSNYKFPTQKRK
jgi:hypothetical protein